jgi:hypothetical protein
MNVTERLGHSTPAFTMATYQHGQPGTHAEAAALFGKLLRAPKNVYRFHQVEVPVEITFGMRDQPDVARWRKRERYSWGDVPTRR